MMPQFSEHVLCNQYNSCHNAQLGEPDKPAPVNQYGQKLEEYKMRCLDTDVENMVFLRAIRMKFVDGLIHLLRDKVRRLIDWDMLCDERVSIGEKIQTTTKLTILQEPGLEQKQFTQWSPGKPIEFPKSDCKLPHNEPAAKQKCKEVTYRVCSFVPTLQGYPGILSCDLNKHISWLLDHVIVESHGIY